VKEKLEIKVEKTFQRENIHTKKTAYKRSVGRYAAQASLTKKIHSIDM
jgi:hypothetical protein